MYAGTFRWFARCISLPPFEKPGPSSATAKAAFLLPSGRSAIMQHKTPSVKQNCTRVMSSCLCKYGEGAGFPFQVESLEDGVDDAVHALDIHKAHHRPGTPSDFHEAAFDHIGGP